MTHQTVSAQAANEKATEVAETDTSQRPVHARWFSGERQLAHVVVALDANLANATH
jgi:hypothetical protein